MAAAPPRTAPAFRKLHCKGPAIEYRVGPARYSRCPENGLTWQSSRRETRSRHQISAAKRRQAGVLEVVSVRTTPNSAPAPPHPTKQLNRKRKVPLRQSSYSPSYNEWGGFRWTQMVCFGPRWTAPDKRPIIFLLGGVQIGSMPGPSVGAANIGLRLWGYVIRPESD